MTFLILRCYTKHRVHLVRKKLLLDESNLHFVFGVLVPDTYLFACLIRLRRTRFKLQLLAEGIDSNDLLTKDKICRF